MIEKKHLTHVSEEKKRNLSQLEKLAGEKRTVLIASIKNIPGSQFQEISKKLRGKALVKVPKKSIIIRALDSIKENREEIEKLKKKIEENTAILFSDMDAFELAAELISKKSPSKAKPGQEAPFDLEIPAGPTELVPGPAISELGALGIQIQIDKGKINIKTPKVVASKGEKISQAAAELLGKLDIKPFTVGFIPLAAFDTKRGKTWLDIKIDKESAIKNMKESFGKALPFAVEIGYVSGDTINFFIGKAGVQGNILEKFVKAGVAEIKEEKTEESDSQETIEKQTQTSEEKSGEEINKNRPIVADLKENK